MRYVSKALLVAAGLFSIGMMTSSVRANNMLAGSFTLSQPTQWKNTVLPAGDYTFKLSRTQTDTNRLSIHGKQKAMDMLVFAQSACETCRNGALELAVNGNNRVVTSLELPGFHVEFKSGQNGAQREQQLSKAPARSEQVAVHIDGN
jgi:hypothetical protein